ncbi:MULTISPECIES: hypothetical protein [unclassified Ruegeria]|uniref:LEM-3-like GIY-YIG domain-containing protein n=1 Tax=unclassified Ruegeria TaxID=2625375 RepID=UPI0014887DCA|nr:MULTISPECIES: hypothetical protein [unclassified Ruegeria]
MNTTEFNPSVCSELGNYVYRLIDPRNGETFYVGQGTGNRVFNHLRAALPYQKDEDAVSTKISRIHEIHRSGLDVQHIIHRHAIPACAVDEVEAALIDAYPGLSNAQRGHRSTDHGPMHVNQIVDKYDLPVIDWEPAHKLILLNINNWQGSGREDMYHQVRFAWRVKKANAEAADFVLAVMRGVVVGAFTASRWLPAVKGNFPKHNPEYPDRYGFEGAPATPDIWDLYCGERGKRIATEQLKHGQNPIKYWGL